MTISLEAILTCVSQGVLESFLGHLLAGGVFCLLGGQPLTVLGCTGPVGKTVLATVFYTSLYSIHYTLYTIHYTLYSYKVFSTL